MAYLIGVDEAGYGPNLGPLVIAATVWRTPDRSHPVDLHELLADVVSDRAAAKPGDCDEKLAIADSKRLHQASQREPSRRLALLELGVLTALGLLGPAPTTWRALWDALDPSAAGDRDAEPWNDDCDLTLPLAVNAHRLGRSIELLERGCRAANVRLAAVAARAVFPARFNRLVERHGTKGAALTRQTLDLIASLLSNCQGEAVSIVADKHGGRNRYGPLLQERFPDVLVEVHGESLAGSRYRWGPPEARVEIEFRARGESFLPTALASMTAKYLREVAMLPFNEFWRRRVPGLRRTAGYPQDARRFKAEIAAVQERLGIADELLWRNR